MSDWKPTQESETRGDPPIRAVCLDFGNVLVAFDYARLWRRISRYSSLAETEMARRFEQSDLPRVYESGKMSSKRFHREMCSLLHARLSYEEFCDAWSSIFEKKSIVGLSFLSSLAKRYVLVLLSNTNEIHFAFIRQHFPILRVFHHFALSYQVGATKPSRKIYLAALRMAQVNPSEAFYADDIEGYVDAARALGFRAAHVSGKNELVDAMSVNGVVPAI